MGVAVMFVLDTCALLWWTLDPDKLSPLAVERCEKIERYGACIASVSIWEIGVKIQKGKLDIGMSVREFANLLKQVNIDNVPVDTELWLNSLELEWAHRDPADRLVVALAKQRKVPILTADRVIRDYYESVIW